MTNTLTIQDRIIENGIQKFGLCFQIEDEEGNVNEQATNWWKQQFKQFLITSITEVQEEIKKENVEVIKKHRPVFFKGDLHSLLSQDEVMRVREVLRIEILEDLGIDCSKMRESLTQKENK